MHVEVKKRGQSSTFGAHKPSERCCQRRCSYAAARANDGGGKVRALCGWVQDLRRIEYSLCLRENFAKLVCAEGLQQLILQPAGTEVEKLGSAWGRERGGQYV